MGNSKQRRKDKRRAEEASIRERLAATEARLYEVMDECDRRQRRIIELEDRVHEEQIEAAEAIRRVEEMARKQHVSWRDTVHDLRNALAESWSRMRDVKDALERAGVSLEQGVVAAVRDLAARDVDAAKLRRRLHEKSKQLEEARAEIGRLKRAEFLG